MLNIIIQIYKYYIMCVIYKIKKLNEQKSVKWLFLESNYVEKNEILVKMYKVLVIQENLV